MIFVKNIIISMSFFFNSESIFWTSIILNTAVVERRSDIEKLDDLSIVTKTQNHQDLRQN